MSAQWYARHPRAGAIYVGLWSLHWAIDTVRPIIRGGHYYGLERVPGGPFRCVVLYRHVEQKFRLRLWRHRGYCEHGLYRNAWWHDCALVSDLNPEGRVPDPIEEPA